ncbi:MAG: DUF2887 domain-containing protein [Deltaproteobacteria bacterium]|nr:DUF2887 domain-containing protein [Deltaproteobacteria bacterium]
MENTGNKGSDEAFYRLLQVANEAILRLAGVTTECGYDIQAETLKSKNVSPDIVAVPSKGNGDIVIMEFQGYHDPFIRYRLGAEVARYCAQKHYTGNILPVIFYTEYVYFNAALPLAITDSTGRYAMQWPLKEIVLEELREEDLLAVDPRLVVLAPFTTSKRIPKEYLTKKANQWSELTRKSSSDEISIELLDILALFFLHRFRGVSRTEVVDMLHLDLANTVVGQELIQMGEERGELKNARDYVIAVLATRFDLVPQNISDQVNQIENRETLNQLVRLAAKAENLETFRAKLEALNMS